MSVYAEYRNALRSGDETRIDEAYQAMLYEANAEARADREAELRENRDEEEEE